MRYLLPYLLITRISNNKTAVKFSYHTRKQYVMMPPSPQALLLSSSNCHGFSMLEFAKQDISSILKKNQAEEVIFVPYAQIDYDNYTKKISDVMNPWGFTVTGIHTFSDPADAVISAKAIFIGGGNTFLLLKSLYEHNLVKLIKDKVCSGNLVYIGSSAGTNVATISIHTTNDMPIIHPHTLNAIGIVPFNINPHYIEFESETHKGETRDQRINEYLGMPHSKPVLGLKEGCILHVNGESLTLKGVAGAVLFKKGSSKVELPVQSDVSFLLDVAEEVC